MPGNWGPLLRRERELHGYSFEDLAGRLNSVDPNLNMDRTTAWRWEQTGSNGRRPRPRYIRALCKLYQKSPMELGLTTAADGVNETLSDSLSHADTTRGESDQPRPHAMIFFDSPDGESALCLPPLALPHVSESTATDLEALACTYRRASLRPNAGWPAPAQSSEPPPRRPRPSQSRGRCIAAAPTHQPRRTERTPVGPAHADGTPRLPKG